MFSSSVRWTTWTTTGIVISLAATRMAWPLARLRLVCSSTSSRLARYSGLVSASSSWTTMWAQVRRLGVFAGLIWVASPPHGSVLASARRLHAFRLARHLRVVRRVGHVARLVALVHLEQRFERVLHVVDRRKAVADLGKAGRHRGDREVLRLDLGHFLPGKRRGHGRA